MNPEIIKTIGRQIFEAEKSGGTTGIPSATHPEITVEDGYQIQLEAVKCMLADGQAVVGKKIDIANLAMQKALGIDEPDYGHVMDSHIINPDVPLSLARMNQPQVEPELAFVLGRDVKGSGVTEATIMAATAGIMAAFEVIDFRYLDRSKIRLPDSIADNACCAKIVLGSRLVPISGLDLRTIGLVLEKNGELLATAASAAVLGSPAASVAWLANKVAKFGVELKAGEIIMSGSFTNMFPAAAGDTFVAHFGGVGSVKLAFTA